MAEDLELPKGSLRGWALPGSRRGSDTSAGGRSRNGDTTTDLVSFTPLSASLGLAALRAHSHNQRSYVGERGTSVSAGVGQRSLLAVRMMVLESYGFEVLPVIYADEEVTLENIALVITLDRTRSSKLP